MTELSPEAADLLQASRVGEPPSAETRRRIRASLAAVTGCAVVAGSHGAVATGSAPAAAPASTLTGVVGAKGIVALVLVGALGFVGGAFVGHSFGVRDLDSPIAVTAPREVAVAPAAIATAVPPAPAPDRVVAAAPDEATVIASPPRHRARSSSAVPPHVADPAPLPDPGTSTLAAELALIRAADEAISRSNADQALQILDEHASRYADGQLAQERESLRVLALCGLGRNGDATRMATAFLARWPDSPHAGRLRASCAGLDAKTP